MVVVMVVVGRGGGRGGFCYLFVYYLFIYCLFVCLLFNYFKGAIMWFSAVGRERGGEKFGVLVSTQR